MRLAILASGRGSNLQSLIDFFGKENADPSVILCGVIVNNPGARALERATKAKLPSALIDHRGFADKGEFEQAMQAQLDAWRADWIALAGFMRLLSPAFVTRWHNRLVNIHPSLLPEFRGLDTHRRAVAAGAKRHGCTVHLVRHEMDTGPILAQAAIDVGSGEDPDHLARRVLELEHQIYPLTIQRIATGKIDPDEPN